MRGRLFKEKKNRPSMQFIYGSEEKAIESLKSITEKDRVAIFSHDDVDGFVSGRILHAAIPAEVIDFLDYDPRLAMNQLEKVQKAKINKIIFSDLKQEINDIKNFTQHFQGEMLILDHHEYPEDLNSNKIIFMKTDTSSCAALIAYTLLKQAGFHIEKLDWLVGAAVIADYTFEQNRPFIQSIEEKYHLKIKAENNRQSFSSDLGEIANLINDAAIYFFKDKKAYYEILKKITSIKEINQLKKYAKVVKAEISQLMADFEKHHEKIGDALVYASAIHFPITSTVASKLSGKYPQNTTIIFLADMSDGRIKVSSRRQDGKVNLPELLTKATQGLKESTAGGHIKAAGGSFLKKDLPLFKKRLFELV